jgi:hypothetical protein
VIFSQKHFQDLSFSANSEKKNFRTFGQNYLKQRHFELFTKSGEFYSLGRIRIRFFSEDGSGYGAKWTGSANTALNELLYKNKKATWI